MVVYIDCWFAPQRPFDFTTIVIIIILHSDSSRVLSYTLTRLLMWSSIWLSVFVILTCAYKNVPHSNRERASTTVVWAHSTALMKNMSFKLYTQPQYKYAHRMKWTTKHKLPAHWAATHTEIQWKEVQRWNQTTT